VGSQSLPLGSQERFELLSLMHGLMFFLTHQFVDVLKRGSKQYHLTSKCGSCPYERECRTQALRDNDLTLIPGILQQHRVKLQKERLVSDLEDLMSRS